MFKIKDEPDWGLYEELIHRNVASEINDDVGIEDKSDPSLNNHEVINCDENEIEDDVNYYQHMSVADNVRLIWGENEVEIKPKIEHIDIDTHHQFAISLDEGFLRKNYRSKWIELVKSTFRRPKITNACQLCDNVVEFNNATELIKHYAEFHQKETTTYNCTECDFTGTLSQEFRDHWTEKHRIQQGNADKYIIAKKSNEHSDVWTGDDEFVHSFFGEKQRFGDRQLARDEYERDAAENCSNKLEANSVTSHKEVHTAQFECDYCHKSFRLKANLGAHMVFHRKNNVFYTAADAKPFAYKDKLRPRKHLHSKHTIPEDYRKRLQHEQEIIKCDICSEKMRRHHLPSHKKIHKRERAKIECNICSKQFLHKISLKSHIVTHEEKSTREKFECKICSKQFLQTNGLAYHMDTHTKKSMREKFECFIKPCQVYVSCSSLSSKNLEKWRQIGAQTTDKNGLVVTKSDIIFICIKPHLMYKCAQQIEGNIEPGVCDSDKLFVSLITGVTLDQLELAFSFMTTLKLIRMIPNTSVQVGAGCMVYTPGRYIIAQNLEKLESLLTPLGISQQLPEKMMDAITALTACGSAYVYTVIKSMADGLITLGIPSQNAFKLTSQTVVGAAKMVLETGRHPAILRDELCIPGESTIFGIHELEKFGIRNGFINAIETATKKNEELGKLRK